MTYKVLSNFIFQLLQDIIVSKFIDTLKNKMQYFLGQCIQIEMSSDEIYNRNNQVSKTGKGNFFIIIRECGGLCNNDKKSFTFN